MSANLNRRRLLQSSGCGFGYLALASLLSSQNRAARLAKSNRDSRSKEPHFAAKAKRIIFLFMEGAISQMTPSTISQSCRRAMASQAGGGTLDASKFKFQQHGETGTWISSCIPTWLRLPTSSAFIRVLHTGHPRAPASSHSTPYRSRDRRRSHGPRWRLAALRPGNRKPESARLYNH